MKSVQITALAYEMLLSSARKKRLKPQDLLISLIEKEHNSK
jgi:hypothetical protein